MYRCQCCGESSKPGEALHKHITYREKTVGVKQDNLGRDVPNIIKEIASEVPVCGVCLAQINRGYSFAEVSNTRREVLEAARSAARLKEQQREAAQLSNSNGRLKKEDFVSLAVKPNSNKRKKNASAKQVSQDLANGIEDHKPGPALGGSNFHDCGGSAG